LWDAATGKFQGTLSVASYKPIGYFITAVAWSPGSRHLAAAGESAQVHVWDLETKKLQDRLPHGHIAHGVTWSPDGRRLASTGEEGALRFWTANGQPLGLLMRFSEDRWLAISPEGDYTGTPGIQRELVAVVVTEDGRQETLSLSQFSKKYGWKNDPERAKLHLNGRR
jgi:WD40 repeat protein